MTLTGPESELIAKIDSAFSGVVLGEGISIYDASAEAGPCRRTPNLANCASNDWRLLKDSELEAAGMPLCFTDSAGFRYYLPALMTWTIRRHKESDNFISDHTIYSLDPKRNDFMETFTTNQIAVTLTFLDYCASNPDTLDSDIAKRHALEIRSLAQDAG